VLGFADSPVVPGVGGIDPARVDYLLLTMAR
jgi:hypothetical protein